jgi:toxin CcdB
MAQFQVYRDLDEPGYLLDCQSDLLSGLSTRLVVPLFPQDNGPFPSPRLNPTLKVDGEALVMMTHFAITVPERRLGEAVASVAREYIVIMNAFDLLLTGY